MKVANRFSCVAAIILYLALANSCYTSDNQKKESRAFIAAVKRNTRPIRFKIRMIDQYGEGAQGYRFKIALTEVFQLFGYCWPDRAHCYYLTTDSQGYAEVKMPGKYADSLSFKETDIDRYIFSKDLEKVITLPMPRLTDNNEPLTFKVIRHGPVQKQTLFFTPFSEYQAYDINYFSIDPNRIEPSPIALYNLMAKIDPIKEVPAKGTLYFKVENTLQAAKGEMGYMGWGNEKIPSLPIPWSVSIHGNGRYYFHETDDEHVNYAPNIGYQDTLLWSVTLSRETGAGISKYIFVKDDMNGKYFWFHIVVALRNNRKVDLHYDAHFNPDGSTNLYLDRWPDKAEFKRYSERCP